MKPRSSGKKLRAAGAAFAALLALAVPAMAQAPEPERFEPSYFGYETEPGMDYGGRTVGSLQSAASRGLGALFRAERRPGLAPAWEFPVAALLLLVQHEVGGHGGRAREFGLGPSYAFGWDLSGSTSIARAPRTNEEGALLAAGGMEADGVLAQRILTDLLRPGGADGARVPLALVTKLDLTLYVFSAPRPDSGNGEDQEDFVDESRSGNDVVLYLVSRQAQRTGVGPVPIWDSRYDVDFGEPLLERTWRDARTTALWNLADPSLVAAVFAYFRDHVLDGASRVQAPALRLPGGFRATVGTRGALGPQAVSRFLDLHAARGASVFTVYIRDLDSSVDRTWGAGAAVAGFPVGPRAELGLAADAWREPASRERLQEGTGWNVAGEVEARFGPRWGAAAKLGVKSEGFLPGRPIADGAYAGLGVTARW